MLLKDDYFPSAKYGKNDPDLGNYLTGTYSSGTSRQDRVPTCLPQTHPVGEVFAWFNTKKWLLRISNSSLFGFGFTGFKPAQDNTRVVGQILAALNLSALLLVCRSRFGINS